MGVAPPTWQPTGYADSADLIEARLDAHYAVQIIGAAADAQLEKQNDDSHTNLFWNPEANRLEGRGLGPEGGDGVGAPRLALQLDPLTLVLGNESLSLPGVALDEAAAWAQERLAAETGSRVRLELRDYDMPDHPVANGAPFRRASGDGGSELTRWFENGTAALESIARDLEGTPKIAIWPHHFDIGGILFLDGSTSIDRAPQIGLGLSPGDDHFAEPYFYVTPWPTEEGIAMEGLPAGRWQQEGFTGAVLERQEIIAAEPHAGQGSMVTAFLSTAITKGRAMVRSATNQND